MYKVGNKAPLLQRLELSLKLEPNNQVKLKPRLQKKFQASKSLKKIDQSKLNQISSQA